MTNFGRQPGLINIETRALDYSGPDAQGKARFPLSSSLGGEPVLVTTAGNAIHTFPTDTRAIEELYLYSSNMTAANLNLSMSFATSSASSFDATLGNFIVTPINGFNGMALCYPGIPATSRKIDEPMKVYVKTTAANSLNISGYVIRYYPRDNTTLGTVDNYGFVE
jgi:hypothetical protein|tara:strand:- start:263 stop:760 length:498 start_codon:yes stop_codon:yes gene_type:complete